MDYDTRKILKHPPTAEKIIYDYLHKNRSRVISEYVDDLEKCIKDQNMFEECIKKTNSIFSDYITEYNKSAKLASELLKTDYCEVFFEFTKRGHRTPESVSKAISDLGAYRIYVEQRKFRIVVDGRLEEPDFMSKLKETWPENEIGFDVIKKYILYTKTEPSYFVEE